jgi:hypothetical protein
VFGGRGRSVVCLADRQILRVHDSRWMDANCFAKAARLLLVFSLVENCTARCLALRTDGWFNRERGRVTKANASGSGRSYFVLCGGIVLALSWERRRRKFWSRLGFSEGVGTRIEARG